MEEGHIVDAGPPHRRSPSWNSVEIDGTLADRGGDEPMGTKEKFWVDIEGARWLCKLVRVVDGRTPGEDWAEWLVHQLAQLLGIPTAVVRPARCAGRRAIVSRSVVEPDDRLVHGNELLGEVDPTYDEDQRRENPGYTIAAVRGAAS